MSTFRSRWDDWTPNTPIQRTDNADDARAVSIVSGPHRHSEKKEAGSEGVNAHRASVEIGPKDLLENPARILRTPRCLTDNTDNAGRTKKAVLLRIPDEVPLEWAEGVVKLLTMSAPRPYGDARWQVLSEDAFGFLQSWGAQAHRLGWTALDIFGAHRYAPLARFDYAGLVPLLDGCQVAALTEEGAVIVTRGGMRQTFRRPKIVPAVEIGCVWDLGAKGMTGDLPPCPFKVYIGDQL